MRWLVLIFLSTLLLTPAQATLDPDPDQIGIYFDYEADENCGQAGINEPFFVYIIITNPTAPEIHGLEFHYHLELPVGFEGSFFRLANFIPPGCVDLGQNHDPRDGDYVQGLASPVPGDGANVIFVTWQFLILAELTIDFYLGPADVESGDFGLPAYEAGGYVVPLGVSSGDINLPVASLNGDCRAVPSVTTSFGGVKSVFR